MAIKTETIIALANFARFYPEGAAFAVTDPKVDPFPAPDNGGVCSSLLLPAVDPANDWIDLPNILSLQPSVSDEKIYKKMRPVLTGAGYKIKLERNVRYGEVINLKLTCDELSPLVHQSFWRTLGLTADGGVANAQEGNPLTGWLKLLQGDQAGASVLLADFWVDLVLNSGMDATYDGPVKPVFDVTILHSPLASMLF